MTVDALIFWTFVVLWLVVAGILAFVVIPRIVTRTIAIVRRIHGFIDGSPIPLEIAKAEADLMRIQASLARVDALVARAQSAVHTIRSTPLVPPALLDLLVRIRADVRGVRSGMR